MFKSTCFIVCAVLLFTSCKGIKHARSYGGQFGNEQLETALKAKDSLHTNPTVVVCTPQKKIIKTESTISQFRAKPIYRLYQKKAARLLAAKTIAQDPKPEKLPMEPRARLGFWIAIGSYALPLLVQIGILAAGLEMPIGVSIALGVIALGGMITAFILGLVALKFIKQNPGKFRGYGLAVAAIVIPSVLFLLTILYFIFAILLLFLLLALFG